MTQRSHWVGITAVVGVLAATAVALMPGNPAAALEVGPDDLRVSTMGASPGPGFEAQQTKIAFDSQDGRYLVVWRGDDEGDGQAEIYGQLIDARTGAEFGADDFVIARVGPVGQAST